MGDLMNPSEVAQRIRNTTSTLAYWRHVGKGPKYAKVGRRVVYRREDVESWLAEQFDKAAT
jgi:predicted site-specific integrase-resolvase